MPPFIHSFIFVYIIPLFICLFILTVSVLRRQKHFNLHLISGKSQGNRKTYKYDILLFHRVHDLFTGKKEELN